MSFERIMAIEVSNEEDYQKYRNGMMPILADFGGSFGYDFKIAEVLKSKTKNAINRVFTLEFPSEQVMDEFFSDTAYLKVKNTYFNSSVNAVTVISMHEK